MFLVVKKGLYKLSGLGLARWTAILSLELLIVFIGVYAPDLLTERRAEQERHAHEELIVAAVLQEIDTILVDADVSAPDYVEETVRLGHRLREHLQ